MISITIASIPPRVRNGTLFKCIDSFLKQSININRIYITISRKYKRFNNLTKNEIEFIKNYNKKIKVVLSDYDTPLCKYIGALNKIPDDEIIFIGDDDQEYHHKLLENMLLSTKIDKNGVFQNRYHIVKTGTAGIIHGFVGLMCKKSLLNNIFNYYKGEELWIDDQFMSMYFFKENIKIYPTIINDYNEIFHGKNVTRENFNSGGDLYLDPITGKRKQQIRELEIKYNIFFKNKMNENSKGDIKEVDWSNLKIKKIIHLVVLDKMTESIKKNTMTLMKLYPDFEYNLINGKMYFDKYKIDNLNYLPNNYIDYICDKIGKDLVNINGGIYINRNYEIKKDFDIYELFLNEKPKYDDDKCLYYL